MRQRQALYRKYRSKKLSEIVGQDHITAALDQALKTNRISHAYLFTGPRGIGKTSIARILAHEVNNLPYDESITHLDIIEIDAASNRRIDEVRDLREKIHVAPSSAKYKVYIIDEVHMLTREAFNALLKTLEEPPAHVVFILATTEVHKLPETIISRTQHFAFKPIAHDKVVAHLKSIAKQEKIKITDEALAVIAKHGDGSFRDSISLLDQVSNSSASEITLADVQAMLGIAPDELVQSIISALETQDTKQLTAQLQTIRSQGVTAPALAKQLAAVIRTNLLEGKTANPQATMKLLEKLIEVPVSADPYALLEIALLEVVFSNTQNNTLQHNSQTPPAAISQAPKSPSPGTDSQASSTPKKPAKKKQTSDDTKKPAKEKDSSDKATTTESDSRVTNANETERIDPAIWTDVLNDIKQHYNTLYGVLRMATPEFNNHTITLYVKFAFHQKRLDDTKNRNILSEAVYKICGIHPRIVCEVGQPQNQSTTTNTNEAADSAVSNPLGTISNIFGGAELLES